MSSGGGGGGGAGGDRFQQDAGRAVEGEGGGFVEGDPAEGLGFVVEGDVGVGGAAGVVEEDEVSFPVEFFGADAVLDEDEGGVFDGEAGFLAEFAAEGGFGGFAPLDFAAGDTPEVGPFAGADHEDAAVGALDEAADGGDGERRVWGVGLWGPGEAGGVEEVAEFGEVFDDEFGAGGAELVEAVVAGEDGAGAHAPVVGGFDVMLHVTDEEGFRGVEVVVAEELVDALAFVPDAEVRGIEEGVEASGAGLDGEVVGVDGAEDERLEVVLAAEFEELAGVGEWGDGVLDLAEALVEPGFELGGGDVGEVAFVEAGEGEAEFGAELVEAKRLETGLLKDEVGGLPDGGQIIDQGAGPVEDDVADHAWECRGGGEQCKRGRGE